LEKLYVEMRISKNTIDKVLDAVRIEEVIKDYVSLKKRGVNLVGLCPFHNEKTPSFTVSPNKGIFKCFGCGKSGDAIRFLMDYEHFTYNETIKHLAEKYNIEITYDNETGRLKDDSLEKESLYNINKFALDYFIEYMNNTDEGRSVGLSYFKQRGFNTQIIDKFKLGYCSDNGQSFSKYAISKGYSKEILLKSGLAFEKDGILYDRYKGRVIFPIHNVSGKVVGFGGRILTTSTKMPKYINSPETEIYVKSKLLYGLYYAKNNIIKEDKCFLTEGYTDVISLNKIGIENVVSSSGTSLTIEQIRLLRRYTKNIIILYDGDSAGIKASFRGTDLLLEEGLNVKMVLLPDGEDPDSYVQHYTTDEVKNYIYNNIIDFIEYKAKILQNETRQDPVKRSELIREMVKTISLIPDAITREMYIRECSYIMKISEQILNNELIKILKNNNKTDVINISQTEKNNLNNNIKTNTTITETTQSEYQEKELIRFLLNHYDKEIELKLADESLKTRVCDYIIFKIKEYNLIISNDTYKKIIDEFEKILAANQEPNIKFFCSHFDKNISQVTTDLLSTNYVLSEKIPIKNSRQIQSEENNLVEAAENVLAHLKLKNIEMKIEEIKIKLKTTSDEHDNLDLLKQLNILSNEKKSLSNKLGIVIR